MEDNIIIDSNVVDVKNDHYILKTSLGEEYKIPTGTVPIEHGKLLALGNSTFLRILLPEEESNSDNDVAPAISPIDSYAEEQELDQSVPEKRNAEWTEKSTKLLIEKYKELKPLVENRRIKTMRRMWEKISEDLYNYKYEYTPLQVETKWKTLERAFKNVLENSKKTGRGKRSCPYERELGDILLKRNSIIPPCVIDENVMKNRASILEESGVNRETNENTTVDVNELSSNSSSTSTGTVIRKTRNQEIKLLAEAIQMRTTERREIEERKYKQKDRFIKAIEERNMLLKRFLEINYEQNVSNGSK